MVAGAGACNPGMTMRVPRFSHETCKKSSTAAVCPGGGSGQKLNAEAISSKKSFEKVL
jgi:hypothetical protein